MAAQIGTVLDTPVENNAHSDYPLELETRVSLLSDSSTALGNLTLTEDQTKDSAMGSEETRALRRGERETDPLARNIVLGSVGILTIVTWLIVLTNDPTSVGWFALHPVLQTLALVLFTYGIVTLQPTSQAQPKEKAAGLLRHQFAVVVLGFPAILVGTWSVWHHKDLRNADHGTTWHGTFGTICLLWMMGQIMLGAGSVWSNGKLFAGGAKAKALWKYHRASGYILLPLLLFTVHLGGAWSHWGENNSPWEARFLAYTFAPLLILAGIYWRVRWSKMQIF